MYERRSGRHRARGFTLVEVSIVVVCVAVLATIASVAYVRQRRSARMSEAKNLVSMIRSEQEAYKSEKGTYANVSARVDAYYPAERPGQFTTAWGGPCGTCIESRAWDKLPVKPSSPVMYGYATVAGVGDEIQGQIAAAALIEGGPPAAASPPPCESIGPTEPFFLIKAEGDTDGDGVAATVLALSCTRSMILTNEGE